MTDQDPKASALDAALERLLLADIDITARAVVREIPSVFAAASTLTRDQTRRRKIEVAQKKQSELRALSKRVGSRSRDDLAATVARLERENAELQRRCDLLAGSMRGLIKAVGEQGMKAWIRFFEPYQDAMTVLAELNALPQNGKVVSMPRKGGSDDRA